MSGGDDTVFSFFLFVIDAIVKCCEYFRLVIHTKYEHGTYKIVSDNRKNILELKYSFSGDGKSSRDLFCLG